MTATKCVQKSAEQTPETSPIPSDQTTEKPPRFPIFKECSNLTTDPYWRQIFAECSKGRFPRGSSINSVGTTLYFRSKQNSTAKQNNYISYKIGSNPEQLYEDVKEIFHRELGLRSKRDRKQIREELDNICMDIKEKYSDDWKDIKHKKIKDPIIRRFILQLKDQYNLSNAETSAASQIVKLGFLFNWISSEQIIYENKQIIDIDSLHFDEEKRTFKLDQPETKHKREYQQKPIYLSTLWNKYLEKPLNRYLIR